MIELTLLSLLDRMLNWGLAPLLATRAVAADGATLRRLLSDPANHVRLAGGPRDLHARVRPSTSQRVVCVELLYRERSVLWATWILSPGSGTTEVDLALQFETRGPGTRLALLLGGRHWLGRRADAALARLAQACARAAEDLPPAAASACADANRCEPAAPVPTL